MPGKHAPKSSLSFLASLARAGAGAIAALGLVVLIVVIAVSSRGDGEPGSLVSPGPSGSPRATRTQTPPASTTPTASATQTSSPAPEPMIPKDKLRVEVLNGNAREGAAGQVADRMLAAGYTRVTTGNATLAAKTTIFYRGALRREAERLLREFPELERIREATTSTPGSARITVVLGADHEPQ